MCLAMPARIVARQDQLATVEMNGITRKASLMLLPEAKEGDYVLVHAGFAMQLIDEAEAQKTLELWKELADAEAREDPAQQVVGGHAAGDFAQCLVRQAQFLGRQFQVVVAQLRIGIVQVRGGQGDGLHMAQARV